nr:hypothetical protein [Tanacetum cinerariifolium]
MEGTRIIKILWRVTVDVVDRDTFCLLTLVIDDICHCRYCFGFDDDDRSIDVDTSDSVVSAALGAAATGIGETTTVRGLKYSSNRYKSLD